MRDIGRKRDNDRRRVRKLRAACKAAEWRARRAPGTVILDESWNYYIREVE